MTAPDAELPPYLVPHSQEEIQILYEDEDLLMVRKPHLLLSVPGRHPLNHDSLILRLQQRYPQASMVHRLDLDTSGIMVVPLNAAVHAELSRQFQRREVTKAYQAVVFGQLRDEEGEIDLPIARDLENPPRQKICHREGRPALTRYKVMQRHWDRTRLLLLPVTGRSHQLRIHLQQIGHPILGCDMYAHEEALQMAPRLLLHASRLTLRHPRSAELLSVACPPDF
jgi:tRNA pseudouridine32 synthase/23S rRNA pseudouridine746 synthase